MRKIYFYIIIFFLCGCQKREVRLTDNDIIIDNKIFSPNGDKLILSYAIDNGAFGQSKYFHTIIETKDTSGIININEFSDKGKPKLISIKPLNWIDNDEILAEIDPRPFARLNLPIDTSSFIKGNTKINVIVKDITEGNPPQIEYFEVSPNLNNLLVVYRYQGASQLEISAIKVTDKLPIVGNLFSSYRIGNPIIGGRWKNDSTIEFDLDINNLMYSSVKGALCKSKYSINLNEIDFESEFSGIVSGWYNKDLYEKNNNQNLFAKSIEIEGEISKIYSWGDSRSRKLKNISYSYQTRGEIFSSYFRTEDQNQEIKVGDKIKLLANPEQPIIHKTKNEYDR